MGGREVAMLGAVVLLVAGALALPIGPASRAGGNPAPATYSISISATKDYGYSPASFQQLPTNALISVTFTDEDLLPHSFTISSREGFVIPTSDTTTMLDQEFTTYPAMFSVFVNVSGDQVERAFQSPTTAGWYEFVCNVSGHFQNGMYGFIAFGENLPANLSAPSRVALGGGTITPLEAGVVGGVALTFVLGVVLLYRRRSASRSRPPG